jgi:hypothetical protein
MLSGRRRDRGRKITRTPKIPLISVHSLTPAHRGCKSTIVQLWTDLASMRGIGTQRRGVYASSCRGAAEVDHEGYLVPSHFHFYGFGSRIPMADPGANALSEGIPVCTRGCSHRHFLRKWRYLWLRVQRDCELG